jgi:hypothetical protein
MSVILSGLAGAAWQFFDNNGNPLSGGLLYTYKAGTTTPAATYTSISGLTAHSNPIVLDAAGRVPGGEIWLDNLTSYKFVIKTSTLVLIGTYDNIENNTANNILYNEGSVGAVTRTLQNKLQESISVKDFGAVGDGSTDDTTAFNLVAAYANSNSCSVYIPTGTYKLSGKIIFTQSASLRGDGKDLSKLLWDQSASSVGIEIQLQSQSNSPIVTGLGFIRTGATVGATGTALKVMLTQTGLAFAPLPQLTLINCEAKNNSKNEHSFAIGFHLDDLRGAYIADVAYRGSFLDAAPTVMYGIGINITGAENPYTVQMQGITVNRANIAINVVESEGTNLSQFDFVGCNTGLKFRTNTPGTARQPQLTVANGHMNSYDYGFDIQDSAQSSICNVNSYKRVDSTSVFVHVKLDRCLYMTVYGFLFEDGNPTVGSSTGIYLQNCQHTAIGINNYQTATTGIYIDANCAKTTIQEQRFNFIAVTTGIVNLGRLTMLPAANTTVQLDNNLAIANNTTVGVTWDSIYGGNQTDMWVSSTPTRLKAPDDGWYIFSYNLEFGTNATGYRSATIGINNTSPAKPNSTTLQVGTALRNANLTGSTGPVYLNADDYATLNVIQTSGGALNVLAGATMSLWRIA